MFTVLELLVHLGDKNTRKLCFVKFTILKEIVNDREKIESELLRLVLQTRDFYTQDLKDNLHMLTVTIFKAVYIMAQKHD